MENQKRRLWGRSQSKPLSESQKHVLEKGLEIFKLSLEEKEFYAAFPAYVLEIGFGDGEHFIELLAKNTEKGLIGAERFINGNVNVLKAANENSWTNFKLFPDDVHLMLSSIPDAILNEVYILFPDPWPKKKQKKRRLLQEDFLNLLSKKMTQNSTLYIASDHPDYREHIENILENSKHFTVLEKREAPLTKYARKALKEGRINVLYVVTHLKN